MYRILLAKIFVFTFCAWILRAADNEKGLSHNVNNGAKNAQNGMQLRVSRLLSVSDLDSEMDDGSFESLASSRVSDDRDERREEMDSSSFSLDDQEELDPDLESFKEYIRHVTNSDKSFKEKFEETKDYIKNMDPMTRKKIKREIKDKVNESRRMKHRRKCQKLHGICKDLYRDLQYEDYKMMSKMRKMEKKMSVLFFGAGVLAAVMAFFMFPFELISCSGGLVLMGLVLIFLLFKKI
ncbi:Plasmodium exported protein, unknown function [Plasmodium vivax]|uniref:Pv-fam-d protein n=6 Tax=Plasmodium vivax TaxID=5855 RepID=A5JZ12_PLAVS|nr:hypothetical protein PVX_121935 [Plasmodium vivax]KMZ77768.1 hypothetical protein PVIIG_00456 [Plasmodium vivax India VII]KMZ84826.1 hypothetical protein PVBG_04242 [Plasmodium vivax Brazil I]KMZ90380.1 hypothetical protein PVMG_03230 [Plasmodium vivax Mauritania I]KMZ96997.1 hypothetical protein PVNG_00025 [Plasmodium vivax North Korean]EDL47223.1 hypothetical protein PVX_121935 [Plasmodium vivax]|eukprot:XP_001616950.1 hypothetical protein [Plasmodium vivax Sal-1]